MSPPGVNESANLARIRDNQRRSRARRKEYVQDLEARLRRVELQGVEAAAEIQIAARRVADENRRLRALLRRHGIPADGAAVEGEHLAASAADEGCGRDGSWGDGPGAGKAAMALEELLAPRRPVCGSLGVPRRSSGSGRSRGTSEASDSAGRQGWDAGDGTSPGGGVRTSPLPNASRQIGTPLQSAAAPGLLHHVGEYPLEGRGNSHHQAYGIEYETATPMSYVQMSSPPGYDSISADYFAQSRGFVQGHYPS